MREKKEINIISLQEITKPVFDDIRGFMVPTNVGTTGMGTAILSREQIKSTNLV
jgi:hypothetical protein